MPVSREDAGASGTAFPRRTVGTSGKSADLTVLPLDVLLASWRFNPLDSHLQARMTHTSRSSPIPGHHGSPPGLGRGSAGPCAGVVGPGSRSLAGRSFECDRTERMERGYYETLTDAGRRLDQLGLAKPEPAPTDFGPLTIPVHDVREYVLKPDLSVPHRGATWTTNSRGMRDREYPIDKPNNTYRIALAGDSIAAGWGVNSNEGFEPLWERMLNRQSQVEIWNHAVPGLAPGQRWEHFTREGWASKPDLVIFQGTPADFGWDDRKLRSLLPKGIGWDVLCYEEALTKANVRPAATRSLPARPSVPIARRSSRAFIAEWSRTANRGTCRASGCSCRELASRLHRPTGSGWSNWPRTPVSLMSLISPTPLTASTPRPWRSAPTTSTPTGSAMLCSPIDSTKPCATI